MVEGTNHVAHWPVDVCMNILHTKLRARDESLEYSRGFNVLAQCFMSHVCMWDGCYHGDRADCVIVLEGRVVLVYYYWYSTPNTNIP